MKSLLIIDDDAEFRAMLGEILSHEGWRVLEAADGDEGIGKAKAEHPAAVLCDLLMARVNGFQVCSTLRSLEAFRDTKIIVTSGRDFASDRQAALEAGADDYLTKPIQPKHLLSVVTRLTGGPKDRGQKPEVSGQKKEVRTTEGEGITLKEPEHAPAGPFGEGPLPENSRQRIIEPTTTSGEGQPAYSAGMRIKFWGVRGSIPTPGPGTVHYGGNTSCVEVRSAGQLIILDAGTGLRLLGRQLIAEFGERPLEATLLLTHTHWDHIQGLPFFMPVYSSNSRLRILGYEGTRHDLDGVIKSQMESPFFPICLREVPANVRIEQLKELSFDLGNVHVEACFAYHPGICVGYKLSGPAGSMAFFPDNELRHARTDSTESAEANAARREFARAENRRLSTFLQGTDVLIMDSQYDSSEYQQHIGWGHGCVEDVVQLALDAEVKQLFLFHHDPDHDDAKITAMTEHARALVAAQNGRVKVEAAREGLVVELAPAKVK